MQFFPVLGGILTPGALGQYSKTWYAISERGNFVVQICSITFLNHVVRRFLDGLLPILVLFVVQIIFVGRRLSLSTARLGGVGGSQLHAVADARLGTRLTGLALGRLVLEMRRHGDVLELLLLGGSQARHGGGTRGRAGGFTGGEVGGEGAEKVDGGGWELR